MATATLKTKINKKAGTITLPLQEYYRMLMVPVQLRGKAARDLDKLVEEGLREYRAGKTRILHSLAELD